MHQMKKKSWCTSRGPHVLKLANVTTNPCLVWPHYVSYLIKLRTQLIRSIRLLQLGQWRGLHTTHTSADTHVRRPHVLKLALQDLWDVSD